MTKKKTNAIKTLLVRGENKNRELAKPIETEDGYWITDTHLAVFLYKKDLDADERSELMNFYIPEKEYVCTDEQRERMIEQLNKVWSDSERAFTYKYDTQTIKMATSDIKGLIKGRKREEYIELSIPENPKEYVRERVGYIRLTMDILELRNKEILEMTEILNRNITFIDHPKGKALIMLPPRNKKEDFDY